MRKIFDWFLDFFGVGERDSFFTKMLDKLKDKSVYSKYKSKETSYYNSVAVDSTPQKVKNIVDKTMKISSSRRVIPPDYTDYIRYSHRITGNTDTVRIGDVECIIPPEFIAVSNKLPNDKISSLRQRGEINIGRGYSNKDIQMTIYFNGLNQLNGYEVEAPGGKYYVDGLRPLLAQFLVSPYVPIISSFLNDEHGIYNVALNNIMFSTVQGYPNTVECVLTLTEVTLAPLTESPDILFHDMIDWDLFRLNYQRLMLPQSAIKNHLPKIEGKNNNDLLLMQIKNEALSGDVRINEDLFNIGNFETILSAKEDEIVIENISISYQNIMPSIQMSSQNVPTSQYLGGSGASFSITLTTSNEEALSKLNNMNTYSQFLTRQHKELGNFGFIRIQNEFINMTGIEFIIIDQVTSSTVPGIPGLKQVSIICSEFDHRQKEREELVGFTPFPNGIKGKKADAISQDTVGLYNKILQENIVEGKISRMEMYPDLQLPLLYELDKHIEYIREFRDKHGLTQIKYTTYPRSFSLNPAESPFGRYEVYADPDYYVFYPLEYMTLSDEIFNTFVGPKSIEPVKTTGRSVSYGDSVPDGFKYDKDGNLVSVDGLSNSDSNSSDDSSNASADAGNTGNALADLLISKKGCGYVWGAVGQMYSKEERRKLERSHGANHYNGTEKWYGKQVFDCSGIICWGLQELGVAPKGYRKANNGVFADYSTPISKADLKPGDLVNRPGEHIGVYIGNGQTIEAMGTKWGVVIGKLEGRYSQFGRLKANMTKAPKKEKPISEDAKENDNIGPKPQRPRDTESESSSVTASHLNKFLKNGLSGTGQDYIDAAKKYNLNPCFTVALSCQETGWGSAKAIKSHNNPGGIMDWDNNWSTLRHFSTLREGIMFVHKNLYNLYISKGLDTIEKIGAKYAPSNAANDPNNLNRHWVPNITKIYKDITGENTVRVLGGGIVNPNTNDEGDSSLENTVEDFKYKKSENSGKVFGDRKQDLDISNFGAPIYLPSPLMNLYKEDKVSKVTDGLLGQKNNFKDSLVVSGIASTLEGNTFNPYPLGADNNYTMKDTYGNKIEDKGLLTKAKEVVLDFWVVDSIIGWAGDIAGFIGGSIWNTGDYEESVEAFKADEAQILNTMYVDMMLYNHRGRLNRAFPGYLFLIADDAGDWLDGRKLWSNYYLYKSVLNISIHQERSQPVHTAQVSITNIHHNLNNKPSAKLINACIEEDPEYNYLTRKLYELTGSLIGSPKLTDMMVEVKNNIYESINIKTGLNVHIRMGYGSNPLMYPTVFAGVVTDLQVGETVSMVAQSYGLELINNVISTDPNKPNGMFNHGSEPSNIISSILTQRDGWIRNTINKKWGENSAYGIEHFGIPRGHEQISPNKEYDIVKNIYLGKYSANLFCENSGFLNSDGEDNANMYLFNKTPWDVGQLLAQALPEFVAQPMYHQFDCRFFYGLPWWIAKYRYDFIANAKDDAPRICESAKSFSQFHYIDSMSDIIDNQVQTTKDDLYTNCVAMYTLGEEVKSAPTVYSDRSIMHSDQSTKVIDTTLEQDYIGPDWLYESTIAPVGKDAAIRIAISNLIDGWNKSYNGEIIILGDTTIKPCDYIFINDLYARINGLCGVREVVHSMSVTTGFTTSIVPDMMAMNTMNESGIGNILKSLTSFGMSYGAVKGTRFSMIDMESVYSPSVSIMRKVANFKLDSPELWTALSAIPNIYLGKFTMNAMAAGKIVTNFKWFAGAIKNSVSISGATIAKKAVRLGISAKKVRTVAKGIGGAKAVLTTIGTTVFPGIGTVVAWVVGTVVFDMILGAVIDEFAYNNCIIIFPLTYKEEPFITGCKGQTKLIPGVKTRDMEMKDSELDKDNKNNDSAE